MGFVSIVSASAAATEAERKENPLLLLLPDGCSADDAADDGSDCFAAEVVFNPANMDGCASARGFSCVPLLSS